MLIKYFIFDTVCCTVLFAFIGQENWLLSNKMFDFFILRGILILWPSVIAIKDNTYKFMHDICAMDIMIISALHEQYEEKNIIYNK